MDRAFAYALEQFFGTRFEPFEFRTGGKTYAWKHWSGPALRFLVWFGWPAAARHLFARLVEVR